MAHIEILIVDNVSETFQMYTPDEVVFLMYSYSNSKTSPFEHPHDKQENT